MAHMLKRPCCAAWHTLCNSVCARGIAAHLRLSCVLSVERPCELRPSVAWVLLALGLACSGCLLARCWRMCSMLHGGLPAVCTRMCALKAGSVGQLMGGTAPQLMYVLC